MFLKPLEYMAFRYGTSLLLRRVLQDRDHSFDNVMDCRSGWKTGLLTRIFLPVSFVMGPIAGDKKPPIRLLDAPDRSAEGEGRPSLHAGIFQQDRRQPIVLRRRRNDSVFPADCIEQGTA